MGRFFREVCWASLWSIGGQGTQSVRFFHVTVRFMHAARDRGLPSVPLAMANRPQIKRISLSNATIMFWHSRCSVQRFEAIRFKGECFADTERAKCMVESGLLREDSRSAFGGGADIGRLGFGQFSNALTGMYGSRN